jgi:hypothetical protein
MGTRSGTGAYRLDAGRDLMANLLTYLGWSANFLLPTVHRFQDAADPLVYGWGAGLLALWLAGLASPGLRRRGWLAAGALYLALLLPALPLGHHTYHYYLYAPLAGLAGCVAAACDLLFERIASTRDPARAPRRAPVLPRRAETDRRGWAVALVLAGLCALNAALLVHKIETMPFPGAPALRADATVDRELISERAITSLRQSALPAHARLAFWSPIGRSFAAGAAESYFERNVRVALFEGLAIRVFFPGVDSVRFVAAYRPLPEPWRYAVYRPDGALRIASSAELDSVLAGSAAGR